MRGTKKGAVFVNQIWTLIRGDQGMCVPRRERRADARREHRRLRRTAVGVSGVGDVAGRAGRRQKQHGAFQLPGRIGEEVLLLLATVWRQNITAKLAAKYITVDPHAPSEVRVNGTVSNMPEFVNAFGVKEGDGLFVELEKRVDIW